jgi:hypothetical protein
MNRVSQRLTEISSRFSIVVLHFRRDMKFETPQKLSSKASWVDGCLESNRAYSKTSLRGRSGSCTTYLMGTGVGAGSATISSSRQKRIYQYSISAYFTSSRLYRYTILLRHVDHTTTRWRCRNFVLRDAFGFPHWRVICRGL